jgi:hypothetical protein
MNIHDLPSVFDLPYAKGEILTTTWPGRIVLGAVIGWRLRSLQDSDYGATGHNEELMTGMAGCEVCGKQ